jgi:2',3'-cyclic-nucleotide 2'-phosphodiesterase (5'-nucleotidase family)
MSVVRVSILHTNDAHGKLEGEAARRIGELRPSHDFYFDTGDVIRTGNLGIPLSPEPVWPLLHEFRCTASVLGNRESQLAEFAFQAKIAGAKHPLLAANMRRKAGDLAVGDCLILDTPDGKIGLVGVMVAMVTARMSSKALSAYLWEAPIPVALEYAEELRPKVDLLIALTHIGYREDLKLASHGMYDVILGGHSHTVLPSPELHGSTWIAQGGSHAKFAGSYIWEDGALSGSLVSLTDPATIAST